MTPIILTSIVGADGVLHLTVPVGDEVAGKEVQVIIRPARKPQTEAEWRSFIESTAGTWQGEFERPEQGEYEQRDELS